MADNALIRPTHLDPSPLGTKEYWDSLYETEISNHAADTSDVGTIWFNDSQAEDKALSFLETHIVVEKILGDKITKENASFLDLGTGNGHFLVRLRGWGDEDEEDEGAWIGRMLGVDYSEKSVEFARRIAEEKLVAQEISPSKREIEFIHWDIMSQTPSSILTGAQSSGWDVVLDKGTFDAISLSEETDSNGRRICEGYKEKVVPLIREGGILLVTSCNWTAEELRAWFEGGELKYVNCIGYRTFSFGGKKGQTISSVCFRKESVP
ncbi:S-adenosyl-L-methionine-dependent methyltransferase [Tricladium varicosporioides]|nr:S-adenosyl-L-methionine-dependent methyltransferase [Hymenoscyphus varicosporioides]